MVAITAINPVTGLRRRRKRNKQPQTEEQGTWVDIPNGKKQNKKSKTKNKALYSRVKAQAKRKFDVWPSAYASAWLVREYKKRGGTYA